MAPISTVFHPLNDSRSLILRRRSSPHPKGWGEERRRSINPEQTPGFRPGKVEGLIDTFLELCSDGLELSRFYMNDKGLLRIRF